VVGVVTLKRAPVTLSTLLPGRAAPFESSEVRPQVGGLIIDRPFEEGSLVKAGQVLYRVDPAPFQAAVEQAQGLEASAEASLLSARSKADRYQGLVQYNGVSKQDAEDAHASLLQAQAAVQQQRAALSAARISLGWATIRAPIAGRIGASSVTKGALVTPGQTTALTTIQRLDPIYVDVTQSSVELLRLRRALAEGRLQGGDAGVPVRLKLEDGSSYPYQGRLQFTDVTVNPATGAVTLRALFPNPQNLLLPGMYVDAEVAQGLDADGLLAPQQGVSRNEKGQPTALVVDASGHAELRSLTTGAAVGDQWLILGGLQAGERLIVEGLLRVKPGDRVQAVPATVTR
jgi:membrane fusion protein (multidrug efflux system)